MWAAALVNQAQKNWMAPAASHLLCILLAMLLALLVALTPVAATTYSVVWNIPSDTEHYQRWSDSQKFYSNDVLTFTYDHTAHNVWQFESRWDYTYCSFSSGGSLLQGEVTLTPQTPGSLTDIYFGSSVGEDCDNGMCFSLTYYTCAPNECPSQSTPAKQIPAEQIPAKQILKTARTAFTLAIVLPVVLVVALLLGAAGVVVFCCIRRSRAQALAPANLPTFQAAAATAPAANQAPAPLCGFTSNSTRQEVQACSSAR